MLILKFFDSFAKKISYYGRHIAGFVKNIHTKCRKLNLKFVFDSLSSPIQRIGSKVCGLYAGLFVIKSFLKKNAAKIDQIFKHYIGRKKRVNDDSIINETIKNYPYCHTKKIYNGIKKSIHELSNSKQPPPFCTVKTLDTNKCRLNCKCESVKKKNLKKD